jgi:hypothetical protein
VTWLALEHTVPGMALALTFRRRAAATLRAAIGQALAAWPKTEPELAELGAPTSHPEDRDA